MRHKGNEVATIVVGVDGSDSARQAARFARWRRRAFATRTYAWCRVRLGSN
jgi:hypothetical protein